MTEDASTTPGGAAAGGQQQQGRPPITLSAQYVKDLSFEVPGAPQIFAQMDQAPQVNIQVEVEAPPLNEQTYEVILHFRVESRLKEQVAFLAELKYGALVTLNLPQEHHQPVLLIEVARMIFPFARNVLSDMTREGGFPPLMLQPLDFAALYRNRHPATPPSGAAPAQA